MARLVSNPARATSRMAWTNVNELEYLSLLAYEFINVAVRSTNEAGAL